MKACAPQREQPFFELDVSESSSWFAVAELVPRGAPHPVSPRSMRRLCRVDFHHLAHSCDCMRASFGRYE